MGSWHGAGPAAPSLLTAQRSRPHPSPQPRNEAGAAPRLSLVAGGGLCGVLTSGPGAPGGLGRCGLYSTSCRGLCLPAFLTGAFSRGLMSDCPNTQHLKCQGTLTSQSYFLKPFLRSGAQEETSCARRHASRFTRLPHEDSKP